MRLVVLYEELAGYFVACLRELAAVADAQILVVHRPTNAVAPFTFGDDPRIARLDRAQVDRDLLRTVVDFAPDALFCGGWATPEYVAIARELRADIPTVLGFDTWWTGSVRQRAKLLVGGNRIRGAFGACFVPGSPQAAFARRFGFSSEQIARGAYCCDQPLFQSFGEHARAARQDRVPRRLLFVGRYAPEKGVRLLWQAFQELDEELGGEWELWCAGVGPETPVEHPRIKHLGFVQPGDMGGLVRDCGVFILPSDFEPWGVALHEFASAGMPLIASDRVGAAEAFLRQDENGFLFEHGDLESLKRAMRSMMTAGDLALADFSTRSAMLGAAHTPRHWVQRLLQLFDVAR